MPSKGNRKRKGIFSDRPDKQKGGPSSEPSKLKTKNLKPGDNQIKPGMVIWTSNPNSYNLHNFMQIRSINGSPSAMKRVRHFELVLEINMQEEYIRTVQLTSMNGLESLEQSNMPKDVRKYLIPLHPKTIESGNGQAFKASFESESGVGLPDGGWFIVAAASKIPAGEYQALETEMSEDSLRRLLDLANANEPVFNEFVASQTKAAESSNQGSAAGSGQSSRGSGKGKRK